MAKKKTAPARKSASAKPAVSLVKKAEMTSIRKALLEKRETLLRSMRKNQNLDAIQEVGDEADQAGQSIEKDILFEVSDNERTTLDQIEGALRKMDKGTYGLCESCQKPIAKPRIKALPFARYCISCQNSAERASIS